jgi:hypothetical protein
LPSTITLLPPIDCASSLHGPLRMLFRPWGPLRPCGFVAHSSAPVVRRMSPSYTPDRRSSVGARRSLLRSPSTTTPCPLNVAHALLFTACCPSRLPNSLISASPTPPPHPHHHRLAHSPLIRPIDPLPLPVLTVARFLKARPLPISTHPSIPEGSTPSDLDPPLHLQGVDPSNFDPSLPFRRLPPSRRRPALDPRTLPAFPRRGYGVAGVSVFFLRGFTFTRDCIAGTCSATLRPQRDPAT